MASAPAWVALTLICLANAQVTQPLHAQQIAMRAPALVQPAGRLAMARKAEEDPNLEALTDEERLAEQRRQLQIAQQREEKKQKQEALEEWREKTGKKRHAEEERERREKQATIDQVRTRNRKDKEKMKVGEGGDIAELVTEVEALEADRKYSKLEAERRRKELEEMILEVDAEMKQQQVWQDALKEVANQVLEEEATENDLLELEEEGKEDLMSEKMKAKKELQEKKEKQVGLDQWRVKTGKKPQDALARERKEQDKTITKKRSEARNFKWAKNLKLLKEEEKALQELEEKYSGTEASLELQRLLQRMQEVERLVEEERQKKETEMDVILQAARERSGVTEEELINLEDAELKKAAEEKAKVKYEMDERKERRSGVERHREEVGKSTEETLRVRKDRQKRLAKARNRMRESKTEMFTLQVPIEEDPYVEFLEKEELEMARAYAKSQAELEWAELRERVGKLKKQVAEDRSRSAAVRDALEATAQEEELLRLETKELQQADEEGIRLKREQEQKRQRLQSLDEWREKEGRLGRDADLERKQQQRQVTKDRQQGRLTKYDSLTGDEAMTDAELDELEMMLMDQYYSQTDEAAAIAELTRKVELIEEQLAEARQFEDKVEKALSGQDDDDDAAGPGVSGGSSGGAGGAGGSASGPSSSFSASIIAIGLVATMFTVVVSAVARLMRKSGQSNLVGEAKPLYYAV